MSEQKAKSPTYQMPYRVNAPLQVVWFDVRQIGIFLCIIGAGNILEQAGWSILIAIAYIVLSKKLSKNKCRGYLRHALWWHGILPSKETSSIKNPLTREYFR
ncbi:type IV conjugative transfer system protein TraL [Motilimonas eburnea]|uniref:type IV conjugative transfer system protein TraL n=1 Tax=Motilimonas eburnea TaxID=1737488 RepID=UPI001E2E49C9|nr:type IV conjugative transfer system protein TraL [Motilimonas eburnea]MCE2571747.1 type IV conjugative transfer system protein TraL [Motilimonas eburnea]